VLSDRDAKDIQEKFNMLNINIPLVIKFSPYRKVVDPLLRFIESAEYDYEPGDMITVLLSSFVVKRWWHGFLHGNTRKYLEKRLLTHKHIVVSTMPLQLKDDNDVLAAIKVKK
jgi:hypothetical protein